MDEELLEIISIIGHAINLFAIIVFFYMASNVSDMKKRLTRNKKDSFDLNRLLEIELFKGNNQLACDLLHEKAWLIIKENEYGTKARYDAMSKIAEDIVKNGGKVSKPLGDYLQELSEKLNS